MKYLLDTNVLIELFKNNQQVMSAAAMAGLPNCAVSEITLAELIYGANKGGFDRHYHEIEFVKKQITIHPISNHIETYGRLRALVEKKGARIDNFDLLIAATALDRDLTLVTHNAGHFERIPGLKLIDWEQP